MEVLGANHTGCAILINDNDGNHLGSTVITGHERDTMRITVQHMPPTLHINSEYSLLILSAPAPCEYQGRLVSEGSKKMLAIYRGRVRENRGAARYKVSSPAIIENLIYDGKAYRLHTPLKIEVINISKSGVRFRAQSNALSEGDRFQMRMKISDSEKLLIAETVNHADKDNAPSEYGCQFLIGK